MSEETMYSMFDELKKQYLIEGQEDYIGLWRIISSFRDHYGISDPMEIRRLTLQFVRELLKEGFDAVDLHSKGGGCTKWSDQDPNQVIDRINKEWDMLGRDPNIGDIVWFNLVELA